MRIFVAVVHAIGEDNEGNTSVVGHTQEEVEQKLLDYVRSWYDGDPDAPKFETLDDLRDIVAWTVDEHDV
jgi:hypothetical protein